MKIATLTLNPALDRSMMFDTFTQGALNRATSAVTTVGGKGINVSRVLKIHGIDAAAYGFCGGDNGETMKRMLDKEGVSYRFVNSEAPTRMNIKITDKNGEATEASESGGPITECETKNILESLEELFKSDEKPEIFVISGSIPRGMPKDIYKTITESAKKHGIKIVMDCDGEALKNGMEAHPYIIKPNKFELEQYAGHHFENHNEMVNYACNLSEKYGVKIIITLGGDGAMYVGSDGVYKVNAPKVEMKGFTGAGDSFLATFISVYNENNPAESLRLAASFSAAKVELEGTLLPDAATAKKYIEVIKAEKIR